MIQLENLYSGYDKLQVLKDVQLQVNEKEIVALIGPNGAGKSTVLKSIFSIANITQGRILWDRKDITSIPTHELLQKGISYVPQGRINFQDLTVQENLDLGGDDPQPIFEMFPVLKQKSNDLAYSLSGGEQQMLALGRALMQKPKLLLLDEPSLGLSPILQKQLFKTLTKLRDQFNVSLLIVEQNAKSAISIADRTYLLEDGQVALTGGKEILKDKKIKEVYLGGRY